jgi:hypothetical protein
MSAVSMKNPQKKSLKPSLVRLLSLLLSLEEEGYEVTAVGFCKIVLGILDEETRSLTGLAEFGYLPSLGSKRLKMRLHHLVRLGYVGLTYSEEDQDYYLTLTEEGKAIARTAPRGAKKKTIPLKKRTIRPH